VVSTIQREIKFIEPTSTVSSYWITVTAPRRVKNVGFARVQHFDHISNSLSEQLFIHPFFYAYPSWRVEYWASNNIVGTVYVICEGIML